MSAITTWLQGLSGPLVYAVVFALVFAEDALFIGFVLPGETAVVLGGVLAATGKDVNVLAVMAVAVIAAIPGDSVGYEVGRRFGPALLRTRPAVRQKDKIEQARELIRRRGPYAVFLGRFVSFLRALVPTMSGLAEMPYRRFLLFNALGGLVWGIGYSLLGYLAGNAWAAVAHRVGTYAGLAIGGLAVIALAVWAWRRHRRGPRAS